MDPLNGYPKPKLFVKGQVSFKYESDSAMSLIIFVIPVFYFDQQPSQLEKSSTASFYRRYLPVRRNFDGKNLVVYFF